MASVIGEEAKIYIIIAIVVIVILIAIYLYAKGSATTSTVTVTNDEGGVTTATDADKQKAAAVADEVYNNLFVKVLGFSIGDSLFAGEAAFDDLVALSNVQFALAFADYNNKYQRSLLQDLTNNWTVFGTSSENSAIQRAQTLGITT